MLGYHSDSSNYTTPRQSPTGLSLDDTTIDFTFDKDLQSIPSRNCFSAPRSSCLRSFQKVENATKAPFPTTMPHISKDNEEGFVDDNDFLISKFNELENEWVQLLAFERQLSMIATQLNCTRQRVKQTISEIHLRLEKRRKQSSYKKDIATQAGSVADSETGLSDIPSVSARYLTSYSVASNSSISNAFVFPISAQSISTNIDVSKVIAIQAFARGHFVRQLMSTVKVQEVIKTIRDTSILLEQYLNKPKADIEVSDVLFHNALMSQIESSVSEFYDIFFVYSKAEQFELITRSRETLTEKYRRVGTFYDELLTKKKEKISLTS